MSKVDTVLDSHVVMTYTVPFSGDQPGPLPPMCLASGGEDRRQQSGRSVPAGVSVILSLEEFS